MFQTNQERKGASLCPGHGEKIKGSGFGLPWVLSIKYEKGNYNRTWQTAPETGKIDKY